MHPSISPINATTQLIQEITRQLDALDSLQLSKESLHAVRLLQLRRLTRRIETLIPGHFGHGERTAHYARLLGKAISLTDDQHIELHYAALLHDIGLLTLPGLRQHCQSIDFVTQGPTNPTSVGRLTI